MSWLPLVSFASDAFLQQSSPPMCVACAHCGVLAAQWRWGAVGGDEDAPPRVSLIVMTSTLSTRAGLASFLPRELLNAKL